MAGSVNKVTLLGRLGADPETRHFQNGGQVTALSIATSETWRDGRGDRQERTEWHRVSIFAEGLGKIADQYLRKGSLPGGPARDAEVEGPGRHCYSTDVVLRPYAGTLKMLGESQGTRQERDSAGAPVAGKGGDLDDDIPF